MRTTVDLPEDLHRIVASVARDRGQSFSATVAELIRDALVVPPGETTLRHSKATGLPTLRLGRITTLDDVRNLDDAE